MAVLDLATVLEDSRDITPTIAAHVLAYFGAPGGHKAGGFFSDLIALLCHADVENRAKLFTVYPGYTGAVLLAQLAPDGLKQLRFIAEQGATRG